MARPGTKSGPSFEIVNISQGETNWTPYVSASDALSGESLDFADDSLWYYEEGKRNPDQIFNDQRLVHALMSSADQSGINPVVAFKTAQGIQVYESITFKAGFHGQSPVGVMAVNGVDMLELEAWDRTPGEFTVKVSEIEGFSGTLESISIRQKELEPKSKVGAPALSYIKIDDYQLLNGEKATVIEVAPGANWDELSIGSIIQQTEPEEVSGRVSEILPDENKIILSELHEGFEPGSEINVIVLDEGTDSAADADASDLLLVNRDGVDYCATVAEVFPPVCELEELPDDVPPWEGADGIYHVIITDPADINVNGHEKIYNKDTEAEVPSIDAPGEWIITGVDTKFGGSTGNWDFGDLTDTSQVTNMNSMFSGAEAFNGDISGWNTGNVMSMGGMFVSAEAFNQDISGWNTGNVKSMDVMFGFALRFNQDISSWCVTDIKTKPSSFDSGSGFRDQPAKQPQWGTCPRGENTP